METVLAVIGGLSLTALVILAVFLAIQRFGGSGEPRSGLVDEPEPPGEGSEQLRRLEQSVADLATDLSQFQAKQNQRWQQLYGSLKNGGRSRLQAALEEASEDDDTPAAADPAVWAELQRLGGTASGVSLEDLEQSGVDSPSAPNGRSRRPPLRRR